MSKDNSADAAGKDMQAHMDLRTLLEAAKIRGDKSRHSAAMKKHQEMQAAMQQVAAQAQQQPQGQPQPDPNAGGAPAQPSGGPTANGGAY